MGEFHPTTTHGQAQVHTTQMMWAAKKPFPNGVPNHESTEATPLSLVPIDGPANRQVAERLNISLSKAYELVQEDRLESYKIDGAVRVSEEQLQKYLDEHQRERRSPPWPEKTKPVRRRPASTDWF